MDGAVAQLGERLNGIQEVVGSIPISSTSILKRRTLKMACKGKCGTGKTKGKEADKGTKKK